MEKDAPSFFEESQEQINAYVQDRMLLLKLQLAEKVAKLGALLFTGITLAFLSFFVLLFISMMGGYFFAGVTGSNYIGFGIVAAFYLLLLLLVIRFRKEIIEKWVTNNIIKIIFEKEEGDHHEADSK